MYVQVHSRRGFLYLFVLLASPRSNPTHKPRNLPKQAKTHSVMYVKYTPVVGFCIYSSCLLLRGLIPRIGYVILHKTKPHSVMYV